jgi:hypothetical protein
LLGVEVGNQSQVTGGAIVIEIKQITEKDDLKMIVEEISAAKWSEDSEIGSAD